jgi:hypothetical protein
MRSLTAREPANPVTLCGGRSALFVAISGRMQTVADTRRISGSPPVGSSSVGGRSISGPASLPWRPSMTGRASVTRPAARMPGQLAAADESA